jgi:hypothetical protein
VPLSAFFRLIIRQSGLTFYDILYLCNQKSLEKVAEQNKKSLEKRARFQEKSLEKRAQHQEQHIINH